MRGAVEIIMIMMVVDVIVAVTVAVAVAVAAVMVVVVAVVCKYILCLCGIYFADPLYEELGINAMLLDRYHSDFTPIPTITGLHQVLDILEL